MADMVIEEIVKGVYREAEPLDSKCERALYLPKLENVDSSCFGVHIKCPFNGEIV